MFTVQDAMKLAIDAFGDQTDKSGQELAVWHSFRIANEFVDPIDQMIALLHDVLEDTSVTIEQLFFIGVPVEALDVIVELTREKDTETYFEYIARIKSRRGIKIKLKDIENNQKRLHTLPDYKKQQSMESRYTKAYMILLNKARELNMDFSNFE